jgi:predicted ATPase
MAKPARTLITFGSQLWPKRMRSVSLIGASDLLGAAIEDAFPGSRVSVENIEGRFALTMAQHGLLRPLGTAELSDGTLRYLLWIAALLTPRPPAVMVLNEPETSLHPDLLGALARLIGRASERTQIVVVTHATRLISALAESPDVIQSPSKRYLVRPQ